MKNLKKFKVVEVTPEDWMKIYEKRKGSLVFHVNPTHLSPGVDISLVAYNSATGEVLHGLPRLTRKILSIEKEGDLAHIVKIGESI